MIFISVSQSFLIFVLSWSMKSGNNFSNKAHQLIFLGTRNLKLTILTGFIIKYLIEIKYTNKILNMQHVLALRFTTLIDRTPVWQHPCFQYVVVAY